MAAILLNSQTDDSLRVLGDIVSYVSLGSSAREKKTKAKKKELRVSTDKTY